MLDPMALAAAGRLCLWACTVGDARHTARPRLLTVTSPRRPVNMSREPVNSREHVTRHVGCADAWTPVTGSVHVPRDGGHWAGAADRRGVRVDEA